MAEQPQYVQTQYGQREALPVEAAVYRGGYALGRLQPLTAAAVASSPAVAAAIYEECQRALLEAADAFGQAAQLAREMPESVNEAVARVVREQANSGGGFR